LVWSSFKITWYKCAPPQHAQQHTSVIAMSFEYSLQTNYVGEASLENVDGNLILFGPTDMGHHVGGYSLSDIIHLARC
jgi:hypothetical protein